MRRLSQWRRAGGAALMMAALAGCSGVNSKYPLSSPKAAVPDHSLEGMWKTGQDKDGASYVYVVYGDHGVGRIAPFGKGSTYPSSGYVFFVTRTPSHTYLNLTGANVGSAENQPSIDTIARRAVGETDAFTFMEYHYNWLGRLICADPDEQVVGAAVQKGELKGTVDLDDKKNVAAVHLTDSPAHILNYFETTKGAFSKGTAWTKLGGP